MCQWVIHGTFDNLSQKVNQTDKLKKMSLGLHEAMKDGYAVPKNML